MNQYQACLYFSESFFHCGSKYGHIIRQFGHFVQILLNFDLSSTLVCRVESIKTPQTNVLVFHIETYLVNGAISSRYYKQRVRIGIILGPTRSQSALWMDYISPNW